MFEGFRCRDCGVAVSGPLATRCPDCDGTLDGRYDLGALDCDSSGMSAREGPGKYRDLLPFAVEGMGEGETPLIEAPQLAGELGVGRVLIKNEAHNPTGSVTDRGLAIVAEAAVRSDAEAVALPTTGNGGQSAAAYAARAGLASRSFVPSRATFLNKAMINVHGGEMRVVEGRFDDARAVYEREREAADAESWFPGGAFESPYRHEGAKPIYYETVETLQWEPPDAVVAPVGHGTVLTGLWAAAREFDDLGLVDGTPRLYAAQPEGCAPVVEAIESGGDPDPWEGPDTVVGSLEIPDPAGGVAAAEAARESGGGAAAVSDDDLLDSAATVAHHEGVEISVACGAAAAAAWHLREAGELGDEETVVLVNTGAGNKDADIVRSRLMGHGM